MHRFDRIGVNPEKRGVRCKDLLQPVLATLVPSGVLLVT
jgi:hypothetical protein